MVLDPKKRQKKLERRKAKEKSKAIAERQHLQQSTDRILMTTQKAPFRDCFVTDSLWDQGMGQVLVSRDMPDGRVAVVNFLLDAYLLGVKDLYFDIVSPVEYKSRHLDRALSLGSVTELQPSCARKLVEGGVAYAESFGFPPCHDYRKARIIFGDVDPAECSQEFEYGEDGKPCYIAGPHDSQEQSMRIIGILTEQLGEDGFHYVLPMSGYRFVSTKNDP